MNEFVTAKVHVFVNSVTKDTVKLYSGFVNNKPYYRIDSKRIPITGEFTGYPVNVMKKWFEEIGYAHINSVAVNCHNRYQFAHI